MALIPTEEIRNAARRFNAVLECYLSWAGGSNTSDMFFDMIVHDTRRLIDSLNQSAESSGRELPFPKIQAAESTKTQEPIREPAESLTDSCLTDSLNTEHYKHMLSQMDQEVVKRLREGQWPV